MTIEYIKEHGRDIMGVGEYVKDGKKWLFKTIEGLRIWKCEGIYYFVEGDKFSFLEKSSEVDDRRSKIR